MKITGESSEEAPADANDEGDAAAISHHNSVWRRIHERRAFVPPKVEWSYKRRGRP
jgi:hypothetical protein